MKALLIVLTFCSTSALAQWQELEEKVPLKQHKKSRSPASIEESGVSAPSNNKDMVPFVLEDYPGYSEHLKSADKIIHPELE